LFTKKRINRIFQHEYFFVLLLMGVNIIIGLFTVGDYGISTDEPLSWRFGTQALSGYFGREEGVHVDFSHGGGFLIPAKIGSLLLSFIFKSWLEPYSWHFVYFLVFQLSVFFIYLLARKFVGKWAANVTVLLYVTQPLLWGHSFMNPKDTPFLALFLGALVLGFNLSDNLRDLDWHKFHLLESVKGGFFADKKNQKNRKFVLKVVIVSVLMGTYLFVLFGGEIIHGWLEELITSLYTADPASHLGKIFTSLAPNASEFTLGDYINKAIIFYDRVIGRLDFIAFFVLVPGSFYWLFPLTFKQIVRDARRAIQIKGFIPAALLLGMCASARTFGVVAIGIIGFYWFHKSGRKFISVFGWYLLLAAVIGFVLWPDLWSSPFKTYAEYLKNIVGFEKWNGNILFEGELFNKTNYPNYLLPKLIMLQLTEPVLILSVIGVGIAGIKVWRKKYDWMLIALIAGWFVVPVLLAVVMHPVIYNGFRHFLFILPPIFIFSGICFEYFLDKIRGAFWRLMLVLALLLPGLFGIFQLHPFEYVYFNSFAGGMKGAFREYELDYWFLSYRTAVEYLNENSPPNSTVSIYLGEELVSEFAREDLHLAGRIRTLTPKGIDYLIITTNNNVDMEMERYFPDMKRIYTVERRGVPLAIVYEFVE
jgi:hypothetical protein